MARCVAQLRRCNAARALLVLKLWLCTFVARLAIIRIVPETCSAEDLIRGSSVLLRVNCFAVNFTNDKEMLKHGVVAYDALCAWCRDCQQESHGCRDTVSEAWGAGAAA
jgi:hypothetical protein